MNFGPVIEGPPRTLSMFLLRQISRNSNKNRFSEKFWNSISGKWAKVQLPIFFPDGPWASPYNERKNLAPTPENLAKMGCNFLGGEAPRRVWANIVGVAWNLVRAFTTGPSGVQNKTTIEPLGLTVCSQESREKVSILKFWFLRPIWGRCNPRTLTPRWDFFAINTLGVKLSRNVKNGPRSLFSFRDMKAQTSMRSKNGKMSQKSAKSKNAHFPRKFITGWKWMNFGTVVDGHNGRKISKKSRVGNSCNSFKTFLNFSNFDPKYLEKVPPKVLRFLAKSTKSRVENTNMAENQNRK